jgi:hypothetical protein
MARRILRRGISGKVFLMLFHEYSLTPHLFHREILEKESEYALALASVLRDMKPNGLLADLNGSKWHEEVFERIEDLPERTRERIVRLLSALRDRNRIVRHVKVVKRDPQEESDWIETAIEEDRVKPYYVILHSGTSGIRKERVLSLVEFLDSDLWEERKSGHMFIQTETNLRKYLRDFLLYARSLEIMDPYLDPTTDRYARSLEVVASLYAKRRGKRMSGRRMTLHTRAPDRVSDRWKREARRKLKELERKYGHEIEMKMWRDPGKTWHDRYAISDQGGLQTSTGFDIRTKGESIWNVIDYGDVAKILSNFRENSSRMSLEMVV